MISTKKFCLTIKFNTQLKNFEIVRFEHLKYVREKSKQIKYGGVLFQEEIKIGVMYIIMAKNLEEASQFLKKDPYFEIATSYEVYDFEQKLPIEK